MGSLLEQLPSGARVVIIRLRSLGDCVLTTPAISLLKTYRPDFQISVIVEDRFAEVFGGNLDIREISTRDSMGAARALRPDLVLNFHGGSRSMQMTLASGAKFRAGFGHHRYSFVYSHKIPRAQEIFGIERPMHTAEHLASAMFWLGVPQTEIPRAKLTAVKTASRAPYAVIHPFASAPGKTWPAERFLAIAQHLKRSHGLEPAFVAGPSDDVAPFAPFRVLRAAPLSDVKNLMAGASLFIGNDSGPAHIAAAFGVPVVVLFGSSDPVTWAPWRTESQVLTSPAGIAAIATEEAVSAIESLKVRA